jgi:hypothetical protein
MTREEFWEVIDSAQEAAMFVRAGLPESLRDQLMESPEEDVLDFIRHFHDCRIEAYRWEVWAVAWIAGGGASEEDFSDFRDWLITLGREAFDATLHDSESILDHADPVELQNPFDGDIGRVAFDVYRELTGASDVPEGALRPLPREPGGRKFEPEDLPRRFPELWRTFNAE